MKYSQTSDVIKEWSYQDVARNYYEYAEKCLDIFWDPESPFNYLFRKLDTTNVV